MTLPPLKRDIIDFVRESRKRLTPLAIEKHFQSEHPHIPKTFLSHSLKELIAEGELSYTYEFGSSFLEPSFEKPVRISDHVVIKPAGLSISFADDDIIVSLQKGAAFGSGRHPSTRLALRAMETVLLEKDGLKKHRLTALDIGTGSGILAIAAVLMGIKKAIGLDIDPCARSEANQNVGLNGLTDSIVIDKRPLESMQKSFFLILANLRFPTLSAIHHYVSDILDPSGFAVLSGLTFEETAPIVERYKAAGMVKQYLFTEKDWAAIVLKKLKNKP